MLIQSVRSGIDLDEVWQLRATCMVFVYTAVQRVIWGDEDDHLLLEAGWSLYSYIIKLVLDIPSVFLTATWLTLFYFN